VAFPERAAQRRYLVLQRLSRHGQHPKLAAPWSDRHASRTGAGGTRRHRRHAIIRWCSSSRNWPIHGKQAALSFYLGLRLDQTGIRPSPS